MNNRQIWLICAMKDNEGVIEFVIMPEYVIAPNEELARQQFLLKWAEVLRDMKGVLVYVTRPFSDR